MQTQKQKLLELFQLYGGTLTLGQLLSHPSGVGYKAASRFSEMKREGHDIRFTRGETPSQNAWTLVHYDEKGQGSLL
jgi:hypothetical protein